MTSEAVYQEQDIYAEDVSSLLAANGLLTDEGKEEMRHFLRGW